MNRIEQIEQLIRIANETTNEFANETTNEYLRDQLTQIISNLLENANEQERDQVSQMMSNVNVQNRNDNKTENFAKTIIEKENEKKIVTNVSLNLKV